MFLFINPTEKDNISLGLYGKKKIVSVMRLKSGIKVTEKLTESILKFLQKNRISVSRLNGIILATGPGGFTSLRICCLIVNTICQLNKIPSYGAPIARLDSVEKVMASFRKLRKNRILLPAYDREPNITIAKN